MGNYIDIMVSEIGLPVKKISREELEKLFPTKSKAWHEFRVTENRPITYGQGEILAYNYTLLAHKDGKGENHFYLTKFLSYGDDMEHSFFRITTDFYHGMVYLYTMEGITDYIFYYQKGKMANAIAHKDLEEDKIAPLPKLLTDGGIAKVDLMAARGGTPVSTTWQSPNGGGSGGTCRGCSPASTSAGTMSWMVVTTHSYTDWYNLRPSGVAERSNIQYNGSTSEYVWVGSNAPSQYQSFNYASQTTSDAGAPVGAPKYTNQPPKNIAPKSKDYPSCESFEYSKVGTANWIATGVSGVWDVAIKLDKCPGLAVASFPEPLYFQLPGHYRETRAAELSAYHLWEAFDEWGKWYRKTYNKGCISDYNPLIREKLLEFIKEEFKTIGGRVDRVPPSGFKGKVVPYKEAGLGGGNFLCN